MPVEALRREDGAFGAVTGYMVYRNDGIGGEALWTVAYDGTGSSTAAGTVFSLHPGREYVFAVSALSSAGTGASSSASVVQTAPAAPAAAVAEPPLNTPSATRPRFFATSTTLLLVSLLVSLFLAILMIFKTS